MKRILIISLIALLFFCGCGSQDSVVKKYYVLERPDETTFLDSTNLDQIDGFCIIKHVDVYPAFATRQIANRSDSHEITYYSYHEWAVRPSEVLTNMLVDYLNSRQVFRRAASRFWQVSPEYKIETTIFQLELAKTGGALAAHMHLQFKLIDNTSQNVITTYEADVSENLRKKNINLFASTASKMFYAELQKFSEKMVEVVNATESEKPEL